MYRHISLFLCSLVLCFAPAFAFSNSAEENGDLLSSALVAMDEKDWVTAEHFASQISDSAGSDLVIWERLRRHGDLYAPVLTGGQRLEAAEAALGL